MESVRAFAEWMSALPPGWIYAVVFAISYGENVVPPIPGDVAIVVAGSLVGLGLVAVGPTLLLAVLGSVLGFMTVYALGRRLGEAVHDPARLRWIPRGPVARADRWLGRWGYAVVAANRFLSGGRAVIALLTGSAGLPAGPVAAWASVSALAWTSLLLGGGYLLGSEWARVHAVLRTYGAAVTLGLGLLAAVWLGRTLWRRRSRQETAKTPPGAEDDDLAR